MNAIEIKNLYKSVGDFQLKDINLTLPQGCIIGLIGQNGAGKTTLIKSILDLLQPESGHVNILGNDNKINFHLTKQDIGIVLDENWLPGYFNIKEINKILKQTYTKWDENYFYTLLEKFNLPINKKIKTFSFGMKKKLNIAIAFSHHCKLLILDEPTAGLDPVVRDQFVNMLIDFTRSEDHSVLISSHIISDLEKICDYIAFLNNGEILLYDEKDILLTSYGIINQDKNTFNVPESAILHRSENSYGVKLIVKLDEIPKDMPYQNIYIEELFVAMMEGVK